VVDRPRRVARPKVAAVRQPQLCPDRVAAQHAWRQACLQQRLRYRQRTHTRAASVRFRLVIFGSEARP